MTTPLCRLLKPKNFGVIFDFSTSQTSYEICQQITLVLSSKYENSATSHHSMLPSWFKPPSSLAWIFVLLFPCFLYCSPVMFSQRVAKVSVSLLFSESSRASSPFIQSKSPSPWCDLHDLRSLDPLTLLTYSFSFSGSLCSSHFPSCLPLACLMVSCIIVNLQWVLSKALVICNLVENARVFFFRRSEARYLLLCQVEGKEMGISRKWAKAEEDEPGVFRCIMRLQINQADRSDQLGLKSEAEKLKCKTLTD